MFGLDLLQRFCRDGPSMTRAALFFMLLLLTGCNEARPRFTQAVDQMIESPLQNTVTSSFDSYPPRPAANVDGDLASSKPQ